MYTLLRTIHSIIILGNCHIWGPFPSHNLQETLICHFTPVLHCHTLTCRCAVHLAVGYIMLSTKCDYSKRESFEFPPNAVMHNYESLPNTIMHNYTRLHKNVGFGLHSHPRLQFLSSPVFITTGTHKSACQLFSSVLWLPLLEGILLFRSSDHSCTSRSPPTTRSVWGLLQPHKNMKSENGNYSVHWNAGKSSTFYVTHSWKLMSYIKITFFLSR
jgi:hypothetical protein